MSVKDLFRAVKKKTKFVFSLSPQKCGAPAAPPAPPAAAGEPHSLSAVPRVPLICVGYLPADLRRRLEFRDWLRISGLAASLREPAVQQEASFGKN